MLFMIETIRAVVIMSILGFWISFNEGGNSRFFLTFGEY